LISEHTPLFGFMEAGYRTPIVVALIVEGAAVVLLGVYAVAHFRRVRGGRRSRV
jgi:heme A synthase